MLLTLLFRWARRVTGGKNYLLQTHDARLTQAFVSFREACNAITLATPIRPTACSVSTTLQIEISTDRIVSLHSEVCHVQ